ncbi:MAG TPA: response regulator [Stenotrophomonas sp.]|nr:response regulator [Stenotrophomonas sp.]
MSALHGLRVLVVENDEMNAMLLELQLAQAGAAVAGPAATVQTALDLVDRQGADLAVLDYRLADGETSEAVAERLNALGVPFVVATGQVSAALPSAFDRGIVLIKPYLAEDLVRSLRRAQEIAAGT